VNLSQQEASTPDSLGAAHFSPVGEKPRFPNAVGMKVAAELCAAQRKEIQMTPQEQRIVIAEVERLKREANDVRQILTIADNERDAAQKELESLRNAVFNAIGCLPAISQEDHLADVALAVKAQAAELARLRKCEAELKAWEAERFHGDAKTNTLPKFLAGLVEIGRERQGIQSGNEQSEPVALRRKVAAAEGMAEAFENHRCGCQNQELRAALAAWKEANK
tara:strand:- start:795 stop:1460 length:666 start_codon:yes stop_codon:yes gene_type:complete